MRWLAVDPGKTVGWATGWREPSGEVVVHSYGEASHLDAKQILLDAIDDAEVTSVVMETFVMLDNRLREGAVITLKVIAELASIIRSQELPLYQQQASAAKGVITDQRLKSMHLWVAGKPHARDAIRHLIIATRRAASGTGSFKPSG